ncbi:MAG: lactate utilization protein [Desulfatibacillum sp.]|nr:lactate utilization protein [Desulfatibacillum sp.]
MADENRKWLWEKTGEKCVNNLKKHAFDAHLFKTSQEAKDFILNMISQYQTFGFGGSSTTRDMGLIEALKEQGKTILDHNDPELPFEKSLEYRRQQSLTDCFLCSANALSLTGEIVNVDGCGNRTNAMSFGPKKVVIVAGANKIAKDLHAAIDRVHYVAAPMRAKSLNMETPCAETGVCVDCNSPSRVCRITTILHRRPMLTDITVVIVAEELGY